MNKNRPNFINLQKAVKQKTDDGIFLSDVHKELKVRVLKRSLKVVDGRLKRR